MTKKQTTKTANTTKSASTKAAQSSRLWRNKNSEYLREYKRAYRQKQKATEQKQKATINELRDQLDNMTGTLNMQMLGVGSGIRDILEAIDRIEVSIHQLVNGSAIKPKITTSTTKMFH
jgi:archaellum component FlaC